MLKDFKGFIEAKALLKNDQAVLIALSGGIDSVVLCHLFSLAQLPFAIAHCNFQLRGSESDEDQLFCKELAEHYDVPFHSINFPTTKVALEEKTSIQLIARNLRYEWLEQIQQKHTYQAIATAHHLNDSIETILYNFTKGTGIRGFHGIPFQNGNVIRPLLFSSRKDIEQFAREQHLNWREDSSNAEDKYNRNKIRQHVIPVLQNINPNLEKTSLQTIQNIHEVEQLYEWAIQYWKELCVQKTGDDLTLLKLRRIIPLSFKNTLLFECLKDYSFNTDQVMQLGKAISNYPQHSIGAFFYSPTHQLLVDRAQLIIKKTHTTETKIYEISKNDKEISLPNGILAVEKRKGSPINFPRETNLAYLKITNHHFPLIVRHWKAGDVFQPLGLEGKHQKLQDFFSNQKLSRFEKDRIWIVETNTNEIAWIVGYRIDERFKLDSNTKQYYQLTFKSKVQ